MSETIAVEMMIEIIVLHFIFRMRNIRSLSLGRLTTSKLAAEDFNEFGVELEDLKITHSALETIRSHAFKNVRGIRRLDLSENHINQIENDAFTEVIRDSMTAHRLITSFEQKFRFRCRSPIH